MRLVISKHTELASLYVKSGVPVGYVFSNVVYTSDAAEIMFFLLTAYQNGFPVLVQCMQTLGCDFVRKFSSVINIRYFLLPYFRYGLLFHRAWSREAKCIGSRADYVIKRLTKGGPTIEQTMVDIRYCDEVEDLILKGRDAGLIGFARAMRLHLRRQLMAYCARTALFA